jgi:hypothetical protein
VIKVTSKADDTKSASCTVTARTPIPVDSVTLDKKTMQLRLEDVVTGTLTATVLPVDAADKSVDWSNLDPTIATIAWSGLNATVTAVAPGQTTVTVTSVSDPSKKDECVVTVLPVKPANPDVYVSGHFGVYVNGVKDTRFPVANTTYPQYTGIEDVCIDAAGNIHASGNFFDTAKSMFEAVWYKNGTQEVLQMNHGADDLESDAYGMTVDGMDVYIAGGEWFVDSYGNEKLAPRLWKNGLIQPLESNEGDGFEDHCWATSVHVYNGVVYVGGETDEDDGWPRPVVWRNGVEHIFHNLDDYEIYDFGIETSGTYAGSLFALCFNDYYDIYGDNGPWTVWRISPDTNNMTKVFNMVPSQYGATMYSEVVHIFAEGDKWWICGYIDDDGTYWTSEGQYVKLQHPTGLNYGEANDIFVRDGDIYVAGVAGVNAYPSSQGFRIAQWKNGDYITGEGAITDAFPGGSGNLYQGARVRGLHVE